MSKIASGKFVVNKFAVGKLASGNFRLANFRQIGERQCTPKGQARYVNVQSSVQWKGVYRVVGRKLGVQNLTEIIKYFINGLRIFI